MIEKLRKRKGWLIAGVFLLVNTLAGIAIMMPAMTGYINADSRLGEVEGFLAGTQEAMGGDMPVLQAQLERAEGTLAAQTTSFLNEDQIEDVLDQMYLYADEVGVTIYSMQSQPITGNEDSNAYVRSFSLQVQGSSSNLMAFVVKLREASIPSVQIMDPTITQVNENNLLSMNVDLYVSKLSPGQSLEAIPQIELPPEVAAFPTVPPPTPTPLPQYPPDYEGANGTNGTNPATDAAANPDANTTVNAASDMNTVTGTNTANNPADGTTTVDSSQPLLCGNAPTPMFSPGATVVVDFNRDTSLRILAEPRLSGEDAEILENVYDNSVLKLIDGPICGYWEGNSVWYWAVEYGSVTGWAGEGTAETRWMCPIEDPECA